MFKLSKPFRLMILGLRGIPGTNNYALFCGTANGKVLLPWIQDGNFVFMNETTIFGEKSFFRELECATAKTGDVHMVELPIYMLPNP